MTKEEARRSYEKYCAGENREAMVAPRIEQRGGAWLFFEAEEGQFDAANGVVVRPDGEAFHFRGALGRLFNLNPGILGNPKSNERVLGATQFGRFQTFEKGTAVWDGGTGLGTLLVESLTQKGQYPCIVVFFDLRGFTTWSKQEATRPNEVQEAISNFEEAVHSGFPADRKHGNNLFVKGTGDGVMIVSQADWYEGNHPKNTKDSNFKLGHGKFLFEACNRTLLEGRRNLEKFGLAIGCAIGAGDLHRVFLFGRLDYIGSVANETAKLQQHAWNEICVTDKFREILIGDGQILDGETELKRTGWRLRSP